MTLLEWLGAAGSVASLIGLVITGYVAWAVRGMRARYTRRAMTASCLSRLRECRGDLDRAIRSENVDEVVKIVSGVKEIVVRLHLHLPSDELIEWSAEDLGPSAAESSAKRYQPWSASRISDPSMDYQA